MNSLAFRVALIALLPLGLFAQPVPVKNIEPELGKELGFISCKFETTPETDQVMVVLAERTELDGKKIITEHILVSSGVPVSYTVTLIDVEAANPEAKGTYVVVDNGHRTVLRNAHLNNKAAGPGRVEFKFADREMHKTPLAQSWQISLEKYETVKARHPDLQKPPPGSWYLRTISLVP